MAVLAFAQSAWAGGLYLEEFATPSMGTASAGAEAVANDASTAFHNPAGMTQLEGQQIMAGAAAIYADVRFNPDPTTPTPGNDGRQAGGPAPMLTAFYARELTDRLSIGGSLLSLSAALLDYDNGWTGRFLVQEVSIFTVVLTPTVAFEITDWLSVGAGGTLMYAQLDMKLAIPPLIPGNPEGRAHINDVDDWVGGYNASFLLTPWEGTRLGVVYFSELETDFTGDVDITLPPGGGFSPGIELGVDFAQMVRVGLYQEITDRLAVVASFAWQDWSSFNRIPITTDMGGLVADTGWDDTERYALGVRYRLNEAWLLQAGLAYDTRPVKSKDRHPAFPIDSQIRYAIGAQHRWSETVDVGFALQYIYMGKAKIRQTGQLIGEYSDNNLFFLAFNINWKSRTQTH